MDDQTPTGDRLGEDHDLGAPEGAAGRRHGLRTWQIVAAVFALVLAATALGVAVGRRTGTNEQQSTQTTKAPATTTSGGGSGVPETGYTAPMQMAARDLDGFLNHAAMADQALTEAASRVNASTTVAEITYDQRTVDLLSLASPTTLASYLPPGMPDALQQAALLVHSDLVSRWAAMSAGPCPHDVGTHPRSDYETNHCFTQGAGAAARFAGDLAALKTLAENTPKFTIPSQNSQPAEELAVRINDIDQRNLGCGSTGGTIVTDLIPVVWRGFAADGGGPPWQGTVDGIPFRGTYDQARGWTIYINAC
jgi:hypothetical protein